jgi:hypothetical protein
MTAAKLSLLLCLIGLASTQEAPIDYEAAVAEAKAYYTGEREGVDAICTIPAEMFDQLAPTGRAGIEQCLGSEFDAAIAKAADCATAAAPSLAGAVSMILASMQQTPPANLAESIQGCLSKGIPAILEAIRSTDAAAPTDELESPSSESSSKSSSKEKGNKKDKGKKEKKNKKDKKPKKEQMDYKKATEIAKAYFTGSEVSAECKLDADSFDTFSGPAGTKIAQCLGKTLDKAKKKQGKCGKTGAKALGPTVKAMGGGKEVGKLIESCINNAVPVILEKYEAEAGTAEEGAEVVAEDGVKY